MNYFNKELTERQKSLIETFENRLRRERRG